MHKFCFTRDFGQPFQSKDGNSDMKISEVLLDLREESQESNYEEVEIIQYEIINIKSKSLTTGKSKKYMMHSPELKRRCVEMAKINDLKTTAKYFGVPLKSLKRWVQVGPDRKKGGGRKIRDPEMEKKLYEWYYDLHHVQQLPVTSRMIKSKALELTTLKDFNASKGWLEKIKKKYNLQISRSLTSSKK